MAAAAAPVLSDGFITVIAWARNNFNFTGHVYHPLIAPPDTATVVANTLLYDGSALLVRENVNVGMLQKAMLTIRPTAGDTEAIQYRSIIDVINLLGSFIPISGAETINSNAELIRHLNVVANSMLFPAKNVTWEGIAMLIHYILKVIVALIMNGKQIAIVLRWFFKYIRKPVNPATEYPGIQNWIDQRNWNDIVHHGSLLFVQPLVVPRTAFPAATEICHCAFVRKDVYNDSRFPFFICCFCYRSWCRIENCREVFNTFSALRFHLIRCHKYPNSIEQNCTCGQPKKRRQDFQASYECCGNCGAFWCRVNGCEKILHSLGRFNRHKLTAHPDPYACKKCRVQWKIRDGSTDRAFCPRCGDNFWCLQGHCVKELGTERGIENHIARDCLWF